MLFLDMPEIVRCILARVSLLGTSVDAGTTRSSILKCRPRAPVAFSHEARKEIEPAGFYLYNICFSFHLDEEGSLDGHYFN
jgi:hypothetical protein